jgi:hypothetical protein
MSKTEKKIIRTMIVIVVCFVVCWFPASVCMVIYTFNPLTTLALAYLFLTMLAYVNAVANPIVYGAHFSALRRVLHAICGRLSAKVAIVSSSHSGDQSGTGQHPSHSRSTR